MGKSNLTQEEAKIKLDLLNALILLYELCSGGHLPGKSDLDKAYSAIKKATK